MKIGALRQTQLPVSSAGRGRCVCLLRLANFPSGPQERPCENWSAAPGCRCPNMRRGSQPACIFGRLPLLRLACFCRRQRLGSAAKHASLFLPQAALGSAAPLRGELVCSRSFIRQAIPQLLGWCFVAANSLQLEGAVYGAEPRQGRGRRPGGSTRGRVGGYK